MSNQTTKRVGLFNRLTSISRFRKDTWLDVLLVPQQGVYDKRTRKFHCEYADRGVYRKHLQEAPRILRTWRCNCIVVTGGFTQKAVPHISEAQGAVDLFDDMGVKLALPRARIVVEESALDSVENVVFGLMAARMRFPHLPIGQVVVWPAWIFKTQRFNLAAGTLGILEQTYVGGGYGAETANDGERAVNGEKSLVARMVEENDPLMLGLYWDEKRYERYQGDEYDRRVDHLRARFPGCFKSLDSMASAGTSASALAELQDAFRREVMIGAGES